MNEVTKASLKSYLFARLKEASTYRGIIIVITAFGVSLSQEQSQAILTIGLGIAGLFGALSPDGDGDPK